MLQYNIAGGNGLKLHVVETGNPSGQPILFIHGWTQASGCWVKQMESPELQDYRLIFFDLRGHGQSEKPEVMEAYADSKLWADDVAAIIKKLELVKPVLVGWSYGGAVISDYVKYYRQDNIAGLLFCSATVHVGTPAAISYLNQDALAIAGGMFSPDAEQNATATQAFVKRCAYKEMPEQDFEAMVGYNMSVPVTVRQALLGREVNSVETLKTITVPTLVIHGSEDAAVHTAASDELEKLITGAEVHYYPETGHMAFYENPDRFNSDLLAFVKKVTA